MKFADYWDMNIPTEYYEDEFLDFEDYMNFTGNIRPSTKEAPHANSKYCLEKYKNYEKFMRQENKKLLKKKRSSQKKCQDDESHVVNQPTANHHGSSSRKKDRIPQKVHN